MSRDVLKNYVILEKSGICHDNSILNQILEKYQNQEGYFLKQKFKLEDTELELLCFLRVEFCKSSKNKLAFIDVYSPTALKNIFLGSVKLRG